MVSKILHIFYKEINGLHQAAFVLGVFALFSQILALVRDRIFAHSFGAGTTLDLYYAAFRVPDLLFVSIASFVSITVLIPFIIEKSGKGIVFTQKFINDVFTVFFVSIIFVSTVIYVFMPDIVRVLFVGFSGDEQATLSLMAQILLLSPILLGFSNLLGSITQASNRFFVYALSPIFYNLGIIFGVLFLYPTLGIVGLVYGVVLGALFHILVQIPVVFKEKLIPRFSLNINWTEMKRVIALSLPRTLGLSSKHIALLVLFGIASTMAEGSVAVFNLSFNLQSVPLSIIGVSYAVATFPTLSRLFSSNNIAKFVKNIYTAARHIIFWTLPILALFIVLRAQIVRTILGSGEFTWADTRLTAAALALFMVSLVAQCLEILFVRGYFAAGKTRTPVIISVFSAASIVGFAYLLVFLFTNNDVFRFFIESLLRVEGISGTAILMLPLAFSIGTLLNIALLFVFFKKSFRITNTFLHVTFWNSFAGAVFMGFSTYQSLKIFALVFDLNTFWGIFMQGFLSGIIGIAVGVFMLKYIIKSREINEVIKSIHGRFWKARPLAPDKESL